MKKLLVFIKGFLMGTCDVIPGVSGGTVAFITGIYDELIDSLNSFNIKNLKLLFKGKIKLFWKNINGNFLLSLFLGLFIAIFTLAKLISYLLTTYPVLVWAFFFGLIIASVILLIKTIKKFNIYYFLLLLVGAIIGYYLVSLPAFNLGSGLLTTFFSGFIAIIAMILPGISGSYVLVILGQYQEILGYVVSFVSGNFSVILPILIFIAGAIIGLLSFSKLLHWIKSRWYDQMVLVLTGFILGSLNKIWPWKQTIETYIDRHGEAQALVEKNILPTWSNEVLLAIGLALIGVFVVLLINYFSKKKSKI